ncbi:uncharacterized protein TNCV_366831 [Trichonephila clavipes]|nr:uncharacterized protein TNCV_366831 [Trichonephila clavipes]
MLGLFLQRLATSVETILAAVTDLTLDKATEISDRIREFTRIPKEIYAVNKNNTNSFEQKLLREIEKLNARIEKIELSRHRSPFRRNSSQQELRDSSSNRDFFGWYHHRFGKNFHLEKCSHCKFQGNGNCEELKRHVPCRKYHLAYL